MFRRRRWTFSFSTCNVFQNKYPKYITIYHLYISYLKPWALHFKPESSLNLMHEIQVKPICQNISYMTVTYADICWNVIIRKASSFPDSCEMQEMRLLSKIISEHNTAVTYFHNCLNPLVGQFSVNLLGLQGDIFIFYLYFTTIFKNKKHLHYGISWIQEETQWTGNHWHTHRW